MAGDLDASRIESVSFEDGMAPNSRRLARFPEVDRAEWFTLDSARKDRQGTKRLSRSPGINSADTNDVIETLNDFGNSVDLRV